jgi:glycerophosphoryl diester phosphodiesterase
VRLYAHRGSPGSTTSENTVPAVSASLLDGADGVEVDLRLSADGVLVVSHDPTLRRTAGSGLAVATSTWQDLRVASACAGVPLARVEQVLDVLAGRPVVLEVKRPQPGAVPATVAALLAVLAERRRHGRPLEVTVSSFSPAVVAEVRGTAPAALGVRTALLGDVRDRPTSLLRTALQDGHDQVHPNVAALLAEPSAVGRAHALGVGVVPWTVNRGRALRRLAGLGVDGVITDVPRSARLAMAVDARSAA